MNIHTKKVIKMAWPSVLESVSISLAGMIDTLMVSTISANSVAAVGLTTQPKLLGLSFFFATGVAVSALVARRKGENNNNAANKILYAALLLSIIVGIGISIATVVFANPIIHFSGSEEVTHTAAVHYYRIIMAGIIFNVISIIINAAQRGAGNTKIAMRTNLTSNIVNVIFNFLLINGYLFFPKLGIEGAALATVLGSFIACVMSVRSVFKSTFFDIKNWLGTKFTEIGDALKNIFHLSYSVFLEQILMRVGFMSVSIMAAHQGSYAMAAHQVAMNVMSLSFSVGDGMQSATVALIGQSLGRNDPEMAKQQRKTSHKIGLVLAILMSATYILFGRYLFRLFFEEKEIIDMGVSIMQLMVVIVLFQVIEIINMGCLRGAGDVLFTTITSTVSVTFIRPIVSYVMCYTFGMGIIGIWMGVLMDQISRFVLTTIRFHNDKWTKIKI